jgi:hypothetical protein
MPFTATKLAGAQDCAPIAGKSTLNRLELSYAGASPSAMVAPAPTPHRRPDAPAVEGIKGRPAAIWSFDSKAHDPVLSPQIPMSRNSEFCCGSKPISPPVRGFELRCDEPEMLVAPLHEGACGQRAIRPDVENNSGSSGNRVGDFEGS